MKHRLRIDELAVDSFQATPDPPARRGTVHGHQSDPGSCDPAGCYSGKESCLGTCLGDDSCGASCAGTCHPIACTGTEG